MWVVSSIRPFSSIACLLVEVRRARSVRILTTRASESLPSRFRIGGDMFDFKDSVVIVTGAGGNLGSAVARGFLKAGAHLCLAELTADLLKRRYPDLKPDSEHY